MLRAAPALLTVLALLAPEGAGAESLGPVYKDAERFERSSAGSPSPAPPPGRFGRLPTRQDGGPGYVGSDWGLGRPAYTGLGSRPDWGRSSD